MTTVRDYLDARRDTLPALPDTVLAALAREVTATDCHRAADGGGYDVATLVEIAGRIVARELRAATRRGGPWTRHGHPIDGVTVAGPGRPPVARCGGPALCGRCATDAETARRGKVDR